MDEQSFINGGYWVAHPEHESVVSATVLLVCVHCHEMMIYPLKSLRATCDWTVRERPRIFGC